MTSKATYRFDDDALHALQASLASYLGHVRHAASYRLIVGILEQHPWLRVFFAIDQPTPDGVVPPDGMRRMRPTARGSVCDFPLPQLPRRLGGRIASGCSVVLIAQWKRVLAGYGSVNLWKVGARITGCLVHASCSRSPGSLCLADTECILI